MRAIILAAGFGKRLSDNNNPVLKAAFSLGGRPALSIQLDSLLDMAKIYAIDGIYVVHNHLWSEWFKDWFRSLSRIGPYVLLHDDGATSPDNARGACGSLYRVLCQFSDDSEFLLICVDTITTYSIKLFVEQSNHFGKDNVLLGLIQVDNINLYGNVRIDNGRITKIVEKGHARPQIGGKPAIYSWLGPAYLPAGTRRMLQLYIASCEARGLLADSLGSFFSWWLKDQGCPIFNPMFQTRQSVFDIGYPDGLILAQEKFRERNDG